jgi:hypothetical protein
LPDNLFSAFASRQMAFSVSISEFSFIFWSEL